MKRIVVSSDLSVRSDRAVRRGIRMAAQRGSVLTVVHVVDNAMPAKLARKVQTEAQAALSSYIASCSPDPDQAIQISVVIGDPVNDINAITLSENADLLILGQHRERRFLDLLKETTLERLVRSSVPPVLLVTDAADHDYTRILCAVDMSRACAKAIGYARRIASDAELTLFHAVHTPQHTRKEARINLGLWRRTYDLPADLPEPVLVDGTPEEGLAQMIASRKPDVLVLGAHTRSNLARYMLGRFAAGLIRKPPCDLLFAK